MTKTVCIMWLDLMPEVQAAILAAAGIKAPEDLNWDVFPVTTLEFEGEAEE